MTNFETVDDLNDLEVPLEDQVAMNLANAGLSPQIIAYGLNKPVNHIRSIIVRKFPEPVPLLDEKLADDVRKLAQSALREAHLILEFGPTEQKMTIIKSMLSGLSRHVTANTNNETEEARSEFEAMLVEMRTEGIPERDLVVTDHDILDVEATDAETPSITSPTDD